MERIGEMFPGDRIRSEEAASGANISTTQPGRVWIIDPLDGTREFSEGREDWAVHVALAIDGEPLVGAVALPAMGVVLGTGDPPPLAAGGRGSPYRRQPQPAARLHPHRGRAPGRPHDRHGIGRSEDCRRHPG